MGYVVKGRCKVEPDHEFLGNGRHFFGEVASLKNPRPEEDSVLTVYLNCLKQKLKLRIKSLEVNLKKQVTDHDKTKTGLIRKLDLSYILIEVCKTPQSEADAILLNLPLEGALVRYQQILDEMADE